MLSVKMKFYAFLSCTVLVVSAHSHQSFESDQHQVLLEAASDTQSNAGPVVSHSTRVKWMRRAIEALTERRSPCPFEAFGSAIVNHTDGTTFGTEVCVGANAIRETGNPTIHGERCSISGIIRSLLTLPR
jgi:hypothetical protein